MDTDDPIGEQSRRAIATLVHALPELAPIVDQLRDDLGDEASPQLVFAELAGITAALLRGPSDGRSEETIERIFAAVEAVAERTDVDSVANVGWAFLDGLGPDALERARPYLGPATEELVELLGEGGFERDRGEIDADEVVISAPDHGGLERDGRPG